MKCEPVVCGDIRLEVQLECHVDHKLSGFITPFLEMTVSVNGNETDRLCFSSQEQFVRFLFATTELKELFVTEV